MKSYKEVYEELKKEMEEFVGEEYFDLEGMEGTSIQREWAEKVLRASSKKRNEKM